MKVEENFVTVEQHKIRYLQAGGSKNTLVLIHGLGASADRWEGVIPHLSKEYKIIAPDLIGFGYSDKPVAKYTVDFFKKFLSNFLHSLDIRRPILIGSSLGGQIVAEYAIEKMETEKIVLVSPSGVSYNSTHAMDAYMQAALHPTQEDAQRAFQMMSGSDKNVDSSTINDFIERMKLPNAKMSFMSSILGLKNLELTHEKLSKISVPCLVIWGRQDKVIPISNADFFVSSIKGCQYIEMEGCGHTPYVDNPAEFSKVVLKFLNQ